MFERSDRNWRCRRLNVASARSKSGTNRVGVARQFDPGCQVPAPVASIRPPSRRSAQPPPRRGGSAVTSSRAGMPPMVGCCHRPGSGVGAVDLGSWRDLLHPDHQGDDPAAGRRRADLAILDGDARALESVDARGDSPLAVMTRSWGRGYCRYVHSAACPGRFHEAEWSPRRHPISRSRTLPVVHFRSSRSNSTRRRSTPRHR